MFVGQANAARSVRASWIGGTIVSGGICICSRLCESVSAVVMVMAVLLRAFSLIVGPP